MCLEMALGEWYYYIPGFGQWKHPHVSEGVKWVDDPKEAGVLRRATIEGPLSTIGELYYYIQRFGQRKQPHVFECIITLTNQMMRVLYIFVDCEMVVHFRRLRDGGHTACRFDWCRS